MSNEAVAQEFTDEPRRFEALIAQCPPNKRATPALIERIRGIEDSSRY